MTRGTSGFNVAGVMAYAEAWGEGIKAEAVEAITEIVQEAEENYIDEILRADTPTGHARVAAGGNGPGRYDTGQMLTDVGSEVYEEGDEIVGAWGFTEGLLDYYLAQEHGLGHVPPVDGLEHTHAKAADEFGARLRRMTGDF